jgi:hypothetical protein
MRTNVDAKDLVKELVKKLADRRPSRTEATVQSTLHALLLEAPLRLEEGHLQDIVLEQPAGGGRRIDVEVGQCVFEVKRDLRRGEVRREAEVQLAHYVSRRTQQTGQRYVGVITDGSEWHLCRLRCGELAHVASIEITPEAPDVEGLCVFLEGVLATGGSSCRTPASAFASRSGSAVRSDRPARFIENAAWLRERLPPTPRADRS